MLQDAPARAPAPSDEGPQQPSFIWRLRDGRYNIQPMSEISRRDWLKTMGAVGAGALVPHDALRVDLPPNALTERLAAPRAPVGTPGDILDLTR